jgi:hypothetical protein
MQPHTLLCRGAAAAAALALALAACEEATGSPTPAERARVLRTWVQVGQGSPNRVLRAGYGVPVVVRALNQVSQPVAGAPIVWTGPAGSGSVSPNGARTDADGFVLVTWTAGTRAGVQELMAVVDGNEAVFDNTRMVVFADTVVGMLALEAARDRVAPGDTVRIRITDARDRHGNTYELAGTQPDGLPFIEFTSLDPEVAALASTGTRSVLVTGMAEGTARIVARSGARADTVTLQVSTDAP